ncbi:Cysteine desulfurase (fragment) [Nostocoides australiense Ben110]|uniref:Cysteine desulfurase n=1 Tax=Nostocoides australiense Ben110 TaxID=1193182 RepID=W6JVY8_9MICO
MAGDDGEHLPHIVTCSALYVDGETLVGELDRRDIAVASGSACTASTLEPSHVLAAMGLLTHGNIRITVPWRATAPDRDSGVDRLITALPLVIGEVRARLGAGGL